MDIQNLLSSPNSKAYQVGPPVTSLYTRQEYVTHEQIPPNPPLPGFQNTAGVEVGRTMWIQPPETAYAIQPPAPMYYYYGNPQVSSPFGPPRPEIPPPGLPTVYYPSRSMSSGPVVGPTLHPSHEDRANQKLQTQKGQTDTRLKLNNHKVKKRRTKTGCKTCRQRRIKCDERKPMCQNCERSKRTCLGYNVPS